MAKKKTDSKDQRTKMDDFFEKAKSLNIILVLKSYYYLIIDNITLFTGVTFVSFSLLNFKHGRYCDGTIADYYDCVNSATYYEYDWKIILLFVIGTLLITFWYLKQKAQVDYEE